MVWLYAFVRFISIVSLLTGLVLFEGIHLRLWDEERKLNIGILVISTVLIALGLAGLSVVRVW